MTHALTLEEQVEFNKLFDDIFMNLGLVTSAQFVIEMDDVLHAPVRYTNSVITPCTVSMSRVALRKHVEKVLDMMGREWMHRRDGAGVYMQDIYSFKHSELQVVICSAHLGGLCIGFTHVNNYC